MPPTTLCPLQIHIAAPPTGWVQVLKSLPQVLGMRLGLAGCTGEPWSLAEPWDGGGWDA